jgi:hypothetical protein
MPMVAKYLLGIQLFILLSSLTCSQIQLSPLVKDSQSNYLAKLKKLKNEKKKKKKKK